MDNPSFKRKSKRIYVRDIPIGGGAPIAVQSMTNTDTRDASSTIAQINRLQEAGCEIVRLAIPDNEAAEAFKIISKKVEAPLIADIHFDHRLAIRAIKAGADGIRVNPGNIGDQNKVKSVIKEAKAHDTVIRIGVNAGSLSKAILKEHGAPTPLAMVESALEHIRLFEEMDFTNIKISLKSSNVLDTIEAHELLSRKIDYPFHIGITEAGSLISGTVKNSIGIGILLYKGIGDTIRVSLSRDPVDEVRVAYEILRALDLRHRGPEIISCPTCGRTEINLFSIIDKVEKEISSIEPSIKVAIMGCVVNGPGEAREADIGIAGGRGQGVLFRRGEVIKKLPESELAEVLIREVRKLAMEKEKEPK